MSIGKRLVKGLSSVVVILLAGPAVAEIDPPIRYDVTQHSGYSAGMYSGERAYFKKKRGEFDREPMNEVVPVDKPSDLPPPTVIAPSPLPIVREFKAAKVFTKKDLKGEDAIFQRIFDDKAREKCILDPQSCEPEPSSKQVRKFLPSD